jgi:DNA modification methylase
VEVNKVYRGDAESVLKEFRVNCINCTVTSPPYYKLRDYQVKGQIGLEDNFFDYLERLRLVFDQVYRVTMDDGSLWVVIGDTYAKQGCCGNDGKNKSKYYDVNDVKIQRKIPMGFKAKELMGVPWRVAFMLQDMGWYLRNDIIWSKLSVLPESVKDRFTKAHEYVFFFTKSEKYYFDQDAVKEDISYSSYVRLMQDIENQKGSDRAYEGVNNKQMKAVFKGNRKEFRGGGKYTKGQSMNNDTFVENEVKGNNDKLLAKNGTNIKGHSGYKNAAGEYVVDVLTMKRNRRTVWEVSTEGSKLAHYATFPQRLAEICVLAGCPSEGVVLDPFFGTGTTGLVSLGVNRKYVGIDLKEEYVEMARKRIQSKFGLIV